MPAYWTWPEQLSGLPSASPRPTAEFSVTNVSRAPSFFAAGRAEKYDDITVSSAVPSQVPSSALAGGSYQGLYGGTQVGKIF